MTNKVLRSAVLGALVACAVSAGVAQAVTITVSGADPYQGYMNVSELPSNGGGFIFGSPWGIADNTAVFSGNLLTLAPNVIGDPDPFWYTPAGGPGSVGNKIMEANTYVEVTGPLAGQTVTFEGNVVANTLAASHVAKIFIRDFAPDFSSVVEQSVPMPASGSFTVSLATINDPARHVQYGFQVKGPDVWVTDVAPFGSVTVGPSQVTPTNKTSWGSLKSSYR